MFVGEGVAEPASLVAGQEHMPRLPHDQERLHTGTQPSCPSPSKRHFQLLESCYQRWSWEKFLDWIFLVGTIFNCSMFVVINLSPHEPAIWGALIRLCSFDISQVCFCSMHALNLGFALWAAGSTLKLMVEFYHLWGGPECDLRSRYKSAWLHFNGWTTERKIPRLCAIDQVFDSVHSSHCMVNYIFNCGFNFTLD